jgi:hypothetical protein
LLNEEPLAWQHGPVFQTLRNKTKEFGKNPIDTEDLRYGTDDVDVKISEFLDNIVLHYGKKSASELRDLSHKKVWKEAHEKDDQKMSWNDTISYYSNNLTEAMLNVYDEDTWIISSEIIPGLVLEYKTYTKEQKIEAEEIAKELIVVNCRNVSN